MFLSAAWATTRFGGRLCGRAGRLGLAILFGLAVVSAALAGGLAWRLGRGPLDVTDLVHRLVPELSPGLTIGRVAVALERDGKRHVLRVELDRLDRAAAPGRAAETVDHAEIRLALLPLLTARIEPDTAVLDGARLAVAFPAPDPSQRTEPLDRAGLERRLASLQRVTIRNVQVALTGPDGQAMQVTDAVAELRRAPGDALKGEASATLAAGTVSARLESRASYGTDGAQVHATLSALSPAALARVVPALAPLAALDAPTALQADVTLDPALALRHFALHAQAGAGTVALPAKGGKTSPGQFASVALDADGTPEAVTLQALRVVLAPPSGAPPSTLVFSGTVQRAGGRFKARLAADVDQLALADLPAVWPQGVGGGARPWLTENITGGNAHDAHFTFTLEGAENGNDLDMTEAGGSATGDDVTLWWLRPVPPVQHVHASVALQNPDTMMITLSGGKQGALSAKSGTVRITGLAANHQFGLLNVDLGGPLADTLALLKQPRMELLSKHPIPMTAPSGSVAAHLTINIPLEDKVTIDQIAIKAHGQVTDTHLGSIAAGKDLDQGQLAFDVTNDGLSITGPAQLAHIPGQINVAMDFRDGPKTQVITHVTAALRATGADAKAAGMDAIGLEAGAMPAMIDYAERRDGTAALQVSVDLTTAAFGSPLGWSKAAGAPGHAEGRALLDHGRIVGLDRLHAEAPGLSIQAHSDMVGGHPAVVHLDRGDIGRSSATGTIVLPQADGDPYRVTFAGPQLDLEGRFKRETTAQEAPPSPAPPAGTPPDKAGTPFVVSLRFDRVLLAPDRRLVGVSLAAAGDGRRMTSAKLAAGGDVRVRADLVTAGQDRLFKASAADLGLLLKDAGLARELDGGEMTLEGKFNDRLPSSPFTGTLDLRNFKVRGAPFAGKLLQGLTVYGLADALRGPGLVFDRLTSQFLLDAQVLDIRESRASSASLGFTAAGRLDFGAKTMNLTGTVVPAYFFNSLPGRIPLFGPLFSPEKGSGVFAADFSLRGPIADPSVSVNPLSALTPGFTRRLFKLFD